MDLMWFAMVISTILLVALMLLKPMIDHLVFSSSKKSKSINVPFLISIFLWLKSMTEKQSALKSLRLTFGPIFTLRFFPFRPFVYVFSHSLSHKALVQSGAIFADRPPPPSLLGHFTSGSNQIGISTVGYGDTWRALRRNITSHVLHPSRINSFSDARSWALRNLIKALRDSQNENQVGGVKDVVGHFRHALHSLNVFMCFGARLDDKGIRDIIDIQRRLLSFYPHLNVLNLFSWIVGLLFRGKWREFIDIVKARDDIFIPLIRARNDAVSNGSVLTYVDSLLLVELPANEAVNPKRKRKMADEEISVLCSEFLAGGTDTTAPTLQWIMANLVKNPRIQARLFDEILGVVGSHDSLELIKEEDLAKMEYLKAVVLESLRRHPPSHLVLPHAVTQQTELGGHLVPKNAVVCFMAAEMGWDPEVWEDPMEFKPERFVGVEFDVSGSREIKMMPFGAGRRVCPGLSLALLNMEYLVANLVWAFEWREIDGYGVDLTEKQEFLLVMKHPLLARITPRQTTSSMAISFQREA